MNFFSCRFREWSILIEQGFRFVITNWKPDYRKQIAAVSANWIARPFIAVIRSCLFEPAVRSRISSSPYTLDRYHIIWPCGGQPIRIPDGPIIRDALCTAGMGEVTLPPGGFPGGICCTGGMVLTIHEVKEEQDFSDGLKILTATDDDFF